MNDSPINISEEYLMSLSDRQAMEMLVRNINLSFHLIEVLQKRVLELEKKLNE
jgi:hypothetical protein